MPPDLAPLLRQAGVDRTVVVQAAPTVAETEFLLAAAAETDFVAGVVGWVDMEAGNAPDVVSGLAADPWLRGLRPMIQLKAFGPQRIIWGSDWPVLLLAADYDRWCAATRDLLRDLTDEECGAVLGGNAVRCYRL